MASEFLLENLSLDTRGEFTESLFLHLRFSKCLQFKAVNISEQHMLGCMSSSPTVMLWGGRFCLLQHHEVEEADFWAKLCSLVQRCRRIRASLQPPGVMRWCWAPTWQPRGDRNQLLPWRRGQAGNHWFLLHLAAEFTNLEVWAAGLLVR